MDSEAVELYLNLTLTLSCSGDLTVEERFVRNPNVVQHWTEHNVSSIVLKVIVGWSRKQRTNTFFLTA